MSAYKDLPHEALVEHCEGVDRENSNLRRHLAWAAQYLPPQRILELRDRIEARIENGGVVEAGGEEDEEFARTMLKAMERLIDLAQVLINGNSSEIIDRAHEIEAAANNLAGYLPEDDIPPMSIHVIRSQARITKRKQRARLTGRKVEL